MCDIFSSKQLVPLIAKLALAPILDPNFRDFQWSFRLCWLRMSVINHLWWKISELWHFQTDGQNIIERKRCIFYFSMMLITDQVKTAENWQFTPSSREPVRDSSSYSYHTKLGKVNLCSAQGQDKVTLFSQIGSWEFYSNYVKMNIQDQNKLQTRWKKLFSSTAFGKPTLKNNLASGY